MRLHVSSLTDVGCVREQNEDYLVVDPSLGLYMVCDGVGGHAAGNVASQTAAHQIVRTIEAGRITVDAFDDSPAARAAVQSLVEQAVQDATREVFRIATSSAGRAGMATTMTMLLSLGGKAIMSHIGDSRLYLLRDGVLHQLSDDHSYVNELVRAGKATPEEAHASPYAHVITRAIGPESAQADTLLFDVVVGDVFLLCTDGLTRHVEDPRELALLLADPQVEALAPRLVALAKERGGEDNVTAIVVRAEEDERDTFGSEVRRTQEVHTQLDALGEASLFRHLDLRELCAVLQNTRVLSCAAGETIVREGGMGDKLYVVLDGQFSVSRGDQEVARVGRGSHIGEMALVSYRPRSATVKASEPARVLVMERAGFEDLVRRDPRLGVKLLWSFVEVLSARLDETSLLLRG